jgi:DNA-directed RNA polymerase subunit RPC12/RpoP
MNLPHDAYRWNRYRCRNCGKTFYEALPEIDEKRREMA